MKPLVFQSDFGLVDGAVSAMYGVAYSVNPDLKMHDLTHDITPYSIWEASYRLIQTVSYWPDDTVFVSVVDPGVGTDRKSVVARTHSGKYIVTPDNGTLTHVLRLDGISAVREIDEQTNRLPNSGESYTFYGRYVAIPSPVPNTTISVQYGLLAFMAVVYGPIAGALIGLIGHALIDFSAGWGIWWSWVIASGVFGLLMGFAAKLLKMDEAEMGKKGLVKFNISQVVCHLLCWFLVAPVLDVYMMGEPWDKLLAQGLVAGIANAVTTAIVGSLLCVAYAATKTKAGSLTKE